MFKQSLLEEMCLEFKFGRGNVFAEHQKAQQFQQIIITNGQTRFDGGKVGGGFHQHEGSGYQRGYVLCERISMVFFDRGLIYRP